MRAIRRLYFYAVALISIEVVLWGLINLLRTMFSRGVIFPGAETLAQALALVLVGVPIFLLHWLWAQRASARDAEEHSAILRAIFLYGVLLLTLIPAVQNTLALFDRTLITVTGLERGRALLGGYQSWIDNLIAIVMNLLVASYFFTVLRNDWRTLLDRENFADVRRLYRYLWVLYGLLMTVFGIQQVLRYLFYLPTAILGAPGREMFINGLALVVVGAPIWATLWTICQQALDEPTERSSKLRLGVLYLLALGGVIVVLSTTGVLVDIVLRKLLGEVMTWQEFVSQIGSPISLGVPFALLWAYYGRWLGIEIDSVTDLSRRAGLRRFYYYILAPIGLVATFIGLSLLFSFIIDLTVSKNVIWGDTPRSLLSAAIATLVAGLPLWLVAWRPMQAEALAANEVGDHARRSLVRRFYLYLVIFATVIGGMSSAIWLFYTLLYALLDHPSDNFTVDVLNAFKLLVLFGAFLSYHLSALRRDGGRSADALAARQEQFAVLVFEQNGNGFAEKIIGAVKKTAPQVPVAAQPVERGIPEEALAVRAVILSSEMALNPPEALRLWLKEYEGQKIIVPVDVNGWYWTGGSPRNGAMVAAQMVRQMAEGQEVTTTSGTPAWQIVAYVFAALFGLQLLFLLLTLGINLVVR